MLLADWQLFNTCNTLSRRPSCLFNYKNRNNNWNCITAHWFCSDNKKLSYHTKTYRASNTYMPPQRSWYYQGTLLPGSQYRSKQCKQISASLPQNMSFVESIVARHNGWMSQSAPPNHQAAPLIPAGRLSIKIYNFNNFRPPLAWSRDRISLAWRRWEFTLPSVDSRLPVCFRRYRSCV